jgi:hypothetical protein
MKKTVILIAILVLLPFSCSSPNAATLVDSSNASGARFAGGATLNNGVAAGTLALITPISGHFFNASSLLSTGKQGALSSQVFWIIYQAKAFSVGVGIGASADVVRENPNYEQAMTYLSATPAVALNLRITKDLIAHAAVLYVTPNQPSRSTRFFLVLSFPFQT